MNWQSTKERVIEECREAVGQLPYNFTKSRSAFERISTTERRSINILFKAKPGLYWMSTWAGIRNELVEQLFHKTSGIDKKYHSVYTTVNISGIRDMKTVTEEEIAFFIKSAKKFITQTAIPFLEKEYSYADYSTLLNSNPKDFQCPYHANPQQRCHHGLIAAKLSNDPRYPKLVEVYSSFMRNNSRGFYLPRFQDLVTDLSTYVVQQGVQADVHEKP